MVFRRVEENPLALRIAAHLQTRPVSLGVPGHECSHDPSNGRRETASTRHQPRSPGQIEFDEQWSIPHQCVKFLVTAMSCGTPACCDGRSQGIAEATHRLEFLSGNAPAWRKERSLCEPVPHAFGAVEALSGSVRMPCVEEGMHQRKLPGCGSVCVSDLDHFCGPIIAKHFCS
jgi:hypothetical protein